MNRDIYFDVDSGYLILSDGRVNTVAPHIIYGDKPNWRHLIKRVSATRSVSAVDVSDATAWEFAFADDLDKDTDPWVRVLDADIDSSAAASGIINVSIDSVQAGFLTAIDGKYRQEAYARLKGTGPTNTYVFLYKILASADVDPAGGTPGATPGNYYTKAESLSIFDKRRVLYTANADCTATGDTAIFTVPTGYQFILKQIFCVCQSITGSGTAHQFKIMEGSNEVLPAHQSVNAAANDCDEIRVAYGKQISAGTAIKVNISTASTYTTHTVKFIVEGLFGGSGSEDGTIAGSPIPVELESPDGSLWTLSISDAGVISASKP